MSKGGSKPGERRGGRARGTPNKVTLERALIAQRESEACERILQETLETAERKVDQARRDGRKLAREVIDDLMQLGIGLTAHYQMHPPTQPKNPNEDPKKFWKAAEFTLRCASELAKYQSPTLRAVVLPSPPPLHENGAPRRRFTLSIFEGSPIRPPHGAINPAATDAKERAS